MTEHTQPDAWKARAIRDPAGRLRWVVEDNQQPFALVVDDGTPETWRRLAVLCNAPLVAAALDRLGDPGDPEIRRLRNRGTGKFLAKGTGNSLERIEKIEQFLAGMMFVVRVVPRSGDGDDEGGEMTPSR